MDLKKLMDAIERYSSKENVPVKAMLGGSYALKNVYGVINRSTDDIDIILTMGISASKEAEADSQKVFKVLETIFPMETLSTQMECYPQGDTYINTKVECVFQGEAVLLNFIMNKKFDWMDWSAQIEYKGMKVTPLMTILEAKGDYNRDKDRLDLFDITQQITSMAKNVDNDDRLPF